MNTGQQQWTTTIVMEEVVAVQCQQWARSDSEQNCITLSMNELEKPTIIFIVCVCVFFVFLKLSLYKSNDFFLLKYNFYMERKHIIFFTI